MRAVTWSAMSWVRLHYVERLETINKLSVNITDDILCILRLISEIIAWIINRIIWTEIISYGNKIISNNWHNSFYITTTIRRKRYEIIRIINPYNIKVNNIDNPHHFRLKCFSFNQSNIVKYFCYFSLKDLK